jgi:long-chain acyl-CoA synthetase
LRDDMIELKPTVLAGVPRVFEKVHEGMEATDQSAKT